MVNKFDLFTRNSGYACVVRINDGWKLKSSSNTWYVYKNLKTAANKLFKIITTENICN